jgi:hypothetical protein
MTQPTVPAVYLDHLTYPIKVKYSSGGCKIVEMPGSVINKHNAMLGGSIADTIKIGKTVDIWFKDNEEIFKIGSFNQTSIKTDLTLKIKELFEDMQNDTKRN